METEKQSEPDSTTLERYVRQEFRKNDDVLCWRPKEKCFYMGTVVKVDSIYKKCLVEYLDNTKSWSSFKDLKPFDSEKHKICSVCKKSQIRDKNNVLICHYRRGSQSDRNEVNSSTPDYYGRGLVKRSTPFPMEQPSNIVTRFRSHAVRKARRLLNQNLKRKETVSASVHRSQDRKNSENDNYSYESFYKPRKKNADVDSRSATAPEVRRRPQRNLLEARLNSSESKLCNPFVTVDNSDLRKNRNENGKKTDSSSKKSKPNRSRPCEKQKSKTKLIQKTIFDSFNGKNSEKQDDNSLINRCRMKDCELTSGDSKSSNVKLGRKRSMRSDSLDRTPGESDLVDTSDDEASSSRGTLEPFIPTPKDFEGQNHPFRNVNEVNMSTPAVPPLVTSLPLPLKTVISQPEPPRLKKRQLSEDDIIIDRNGQVKRRRRHRKMGTSLAAMNSSGKNGRKQWNVSNEKKTLQPLVNNREEFTLNGRTLRARDSLKISEKPMPAPTPSPVKQSAKEVAPLTEDLESSVKYFFGAANRILNGEKYVIRAKRITPDGKLQCLIDWQVSETYIEENQSMLH